MVGGLGEGESCENLVDEERAAEWESMGGKERALLWLFLFVGVEGWVRGSEVHRGILCILCVVWVRVEAEVQFGSDVFIKEWRLLFEIFE